MYFSDFISLTYAKMLIWLLESLSSDAIDLYKRHSGLSLAEPSKLNRLLSEKDSNISSIILFPSHSLRNVSYLFNMISSPFCD